MEQYQSLGAIRTVSGVLSTERQLHWSRPVADSRHLSKSCRSLSNWSLYLIRGVQCCLLLFELFSKDLMRSVSFWNSTCSNNLNSYIWVFVEISQLSVFREFTVVILQEKITLFSSVTRAIALFVILKLPLNIKAWVKLPFCSAYHRLV